MRVVPRVKLTRRTGFKLAISALSSRLFRGRLAADPLAGLAERIPARSAEAPTGSQFAASVANLDKEEREHAILTQLLKGNLPGFLRKLVPVHLTHQLTAGAALAATIFVMPEYLAIGSDGDFLRIPMNLYTAGNVARSFGCILPTRKMVDAIYDQSNSRFTPQPLPAGPQMTSVEYFQRHNSMIEQQSQTRRLPPPGSLAAGHKKDVVLTNWLRRNPGHIAIYGWHRAKGDPIQPLSTVHGAGYADYSHGIRLVANLALIEGKARPLSEVLQDAVAAPVLSDEGPVHVPGIIGA